MNAAGSATVGPRGDRGEGAWGLKATSAAANHIKLCCTVPDVPLFRPFIIGGCATRWAHPPPHTHPVPHPFQGRLKVLTADGCGSQIFALCQGTGKNCLNLKKR